jgi:hypothetical protein
MKARHIVHIGVLLCAAACAISCESMPINYSRTQSWFLKEKPVWGTVTLLGVTVDRIGGWDSVEQDITGLAPLFFWEAGYRMIPGGSPADYAADIQLREREYRSGWRTKRSLLVEVRIWPHGDGSAGRTAYAETLPLAAGRIIFMGDRSLSSFETTNRMLSRAIQKAVGQLAALKRNKK